MCDCNTISQAVYDFFRTAESNPTDEHDIQYFVSPDEPIVLYGAGSCLYSFALSVLEKYPLNIVAVLDKKVKTCEQWKGIPLYSPDTYRFPPNVKTVIVTVGKKELFSEIKKRFEEMGVEKIIFATDIYQFHTMLFPIKAEQEKHLYFRKYLDRIIKSGNMLYDQESKDVFGAILKTYILRIPQTIPCHSGIEQYFPDDLFEKKVYQRVVHCGGYHGETILTMNKKIGKVESIICIEGNIDNYSVMQKNLSQIKNNIADELILIPCLISDKNSTMRFIQDDIVSRNSEDGDIVLPTVSLDSLLMNFHPTYITMDIEGGEENAIAGCKEIIKRFQPSLAVSIYHTPAHLWDILLILNEYCPEYKFAIRNYSGWIGDTVLYAFV
jgi:FkbM family methyltransferase